jgi:hypothetical protein
MLSNEAKMMLAQETMDVLDEGEVMDPVGVYNKVRSRLPRMDGLQKAYFVDELFPKTKEQWDKPLMKSMRALVKQEGELRHELRDAIYAITPTGPDDTRALMESARGVLEKDGRQLFNAIRGLLERLPGPLVERCKLCWPEDIAAPIEDESNE